MWEICRVCGKLLVAETSYWACWKKCYNMDCSARYFEDGSYTYLQRNSEGKNCRIRKFPDDKTMVEYVYPD